MRFKKQQIIKENVRIFRQMLGNAAVDVNK